MNESPSTSDVGNQQRQKINLGKYVLVRLKAGTWRESQDTEWTLRWLSAFELEDFFSSIAIEPDDEALLDIIREEVHALVYFDYSGSTCRVFRWILGTSLDDAQLVELDTPMNEGSFAIKIEHWKETPALQEFSKSSEYISASRSANK